MSRKKVEVVFLRGKRVVLRPLMRSDIPQLILWINDPEVRRFLMTYLPMMEVDEDNWLRSLSKRKSTDLVFAIVVKGKIIGTMALHHMSSRDRSAVTGALIGEKEYWGRGYGTEAKMLLLHYAFCTLNLRKIYSEVIAFNSRSRRYLKKCGYKKEGRSREAYFVDGEYHDSIQLAVFRGDWLPLWAKFAKKNGLASM